LLAGRVVQATGACATSVLSRAIARDLFKAVERVELVLPETGVCNRAGVRDANICCGGPALSGVDACCAADANAKQRGKMGCGCPS
jgi:hypothetical protein